MYNLFVTILHYFSKTIFYFSSRKTV